LGLRDLLAFLTTLPLGGGSLEGAASSFPLAPVAGLIVGGIAAGLGAVLAPLTPAGAGLLYAAAYVLVTGALHLDGYADVEDVLASGLRGSDALRVLKDPRRGSHSIAMLAGGLLASAGAAAALAARGAVILVVSAIEVHVGASEAMFAAARSSRPPPYRGLSTLFHKAAKSPGALRLNLAVLAPAAAAPLLASYPLGGWVRVVIAASAGLAASLAAALYARRRAEGVLGFVNGDVLGYIYEVSRIAGLLASALAVALYALL